MCNKFLATITVEEFIETLRENGYIVRAQAPEKAPAQAAPATLDFSDSSRYGYGLTALKSRYHVSHVTAQRLKDGPLAPAIYQGRRGGKFYLDFAASDAIMKERKAKKATNAQTVTA